MRGNIEVLARSLSTEETFARDEQVRTAIEQIYPRLYGYARFRLGREDAQDAVASALEGVWRKRAAFDGRRGDPTGWAYVVGLNGIRDAMRKMRREPRRVPIGDLDLVAPDDGPTRQRILEAIEVIRRFPAVDADLLAMRFGAGLTNAEIGERTGRSAGAVATAVHRALAHVREALAKDGAGS